MGLFDTKTLFNATDYLTWELCGIFLRIFFLSHYSMSKQLCTSSKYNEEEEHK